MKDFEKLLCLMRRIVNVFKFLKERVGEELYEIRLQYNNICFFSYENILLRRFYEEHFFGSKILTDIFLWHLIWETIFILNTLYQCQYIVADCYTINPGILIPGNILLSSLVWAVPQGREKVSVGWNETVY